jgi:hypothetical protein
MNIQISATTDLIVYANPDKQEVCRPCVSESLSALASARSGFRRLMEKALRSCHLQLNRGAAHLEIDFAVNSRSRVPVLQLIRGANGVPFLSLTRPYIPHVGAYRQARSPSYYGSYGGLEPASAQRAFPKGILHLNGEPIASPFAPRFKCKFRDFVAK